MISTAGKGGITILLKSVEVELLPISVSQKKLLSQKVIMGQDKLLRRNKFQLVQRKMIATSSHQLQPTSKNPECLNRKEIAEISPKKLTKNGHQDQK